MRAMLLATSQFFDEQRDMLDDMKPTPQDQLVPCALRRYLENTGKRIEKLTSHERQIAFKNWVAYELSIAATLHSEERLTCPLLSCQMTFVDSDGLLKHVAECSKLHTTAYLCPFCARSETVQPKYGDGQESHQTLLRRTRSKIKRAVIFFRDIGLRAPPRDTKYDISKPINHHEKIWLGFVASKPQCEPQPIGQSFNTTNVLDKRDPIGEPDTVNGSQLKEPIVFGKGGQTAVGKVVENVLGEGPDHKLAELPDRLVSMMQKAEPSTPGSMTVELPGQRTSLSELSTPGIPAWLSIKFSGFSTPPTDQLPIQELGTTSPSIKPLVDLATPATSGTTTTPLGCEVKLDSSRSHETRDSGYNSPNGFGNSDTVFPPPQGTRWLAELPKAHESLSSSRLPQLNKPPIDLTLFETELQVVKPPSLRLDQDTLTSPDASHKACTHPNLVETQIAAEILPTYLLVAELRQIFQVLYHEWSSRLVHDPELHSIYSQSPSDQAFESALEHLQHFTEGKLPQKVHSIIILMQLAAACLYCQYGSHNMPSWNEFFASIMDWGNAILISSDRIIFVKIMIRVMGPRPYSQLKAYTYNTRSRSRHLSSMNSQDYALQASQSCCPSADTTRLKPLKLHEDEAVSTLWSRLHNAKVMRSCYETLDDIAFSDLLERRSMHDTAVSGLANLPSVNAAALTQELVWKLRLQVQTAVIQNQIAGVEDQIKNGVLRNPREVEVALLSFRKRLGHITEQTQYRDVVTGICDEHMVKRGAGNVWRSCFRAAEMNLVIAIATEERPSYRSLNIPTFDESVINEIPLIGTELAAQTVHSPSDTSFPLPTVANKAQNGSLSLSTHLRGKSIQRRRRFNKPELQISTDSSAPSPAPPTSMQNPASSNGRKVRCHVCSELHTKGNIQRHIRYQHEYSERVPCPEPNCSTILSRPDNVEKHRRLKHSKMSPTEQTAKRRRVDSHFHVM